MKIVALINQQRSNNNIIIKNYKETLQKAILQNN